jgi:hypothetical protein
MDAKKRSRILAIDLGFSSVKVAYYNEEGVLVLEKYISAIAKVPEPEILEDNDDTVFKLGLEYYVLSSAALKVARSYQLSLESFQGLCQVYPAWISYLLKKYGGVERFDHVAIGLSMAYADKADDLLNTLYDTLMIDKQGYFMLFSQGSAAKKTYQTCALNIKETTTRNDYKMKNYIICDGGFETIDICNVVGNAVAGATVGLENTGVIMVAYDIQDYLYKNFEIKESIKGCQDILDNDGIFIRRGRRYDISEVVDGLIQKYLTNVLKLLEDRFSEFLDAAEGILMCGGISYLFKKALKVESFVKEVEKHFPVSFLHFPTEDAEYYNVFSYLKVAESLLEKEN